MTDYRPFFVSCIITGHIGNFCAGVGCHTFKPRGNKKTSPKSAVAAARRIARLGGCEVTEVLRVTRADDGADVTREALEEYKEGQKI